MHQINIAIIGVGNCCSALIQGLAYYAESDLHGSGICYENIGGYTIKAIKPVLAYDVDKRKVGKKLSEAIFAKPNCARVFKKSTPYACVVKRGVTLDGIAPHMIDFHPDLNFIVSSEKEPTMDDIVDDLKKNNVDILINYCPVGSDDATKFYVECALKAHVPFLNCIPVFIASDPLWEQKFIDAKLPLIGDDMRSQLGSSIVSQVLQEVALDRGCNVTFHQQLNVGGNTDFANMVKEERLRSKHISKENVIRSQYQIRDIKCDKDMVYAGPCGCIPHYGDKKIAHIHIEAEGFGGAPINIDVKLAVQDSENSASVVIDAIRYLKVAHELGISGAVKGPSAWTQKTPPQQMRLSDAKIECAALANRELTASTKKQVRK